jgi:hypothetical protein
VASSCSKKRNDITGNTLRVYFYLVRRRDNCSVRDIQRALGFSSTSTAYYHLEKLMNRGILIRDSFGNYDVDDDVSIGFMRSFFIVRGFVFPKQLVYAVTTTALSVFFVVSFWNYIGVTAIMSLIPNFLASGILWYNTARQWSTLPSVDKECSTTPQRSSNL